MTDPQRTFRALADPTRRAILNRLTRGPLTIGEVAEGFDMTRPAVKKHLAILAEGALITVEAQGRARINRLRPAGLAPVIDWLATFDAFWDDRLSDLKTAIEKETRNDD
ncbi:MAG: metalloregulator ArsR/SmtB family transcription factor [Pseudomonadota bacterium]